MGGGCCHNSRGRPELMQFYALGVRGMLTTTRRGLTERRRAAYHSGDNQTRHSRRGPNHICVYCPPPDARRGPKHICVYCPPINPNPQQGHAAGPLADDVLPLHPWPKTQIASAYTGLSDPSTYKDNPANRWLGPAVPDGGAGCGPAPTRRAPPKRRRSAAGEPSEPPFPRPTAPRH